MKYYADEAVYVFTNSQLKNKNERDICVMENTLWTLAEDQLTNMVWNNKSVEAIPCSQK